MKPEISVIIPTYKRPQFLGGAIKSVLNQTFQDFEIIICNDDRDEGGIYETEEIIKGFGDSRISHIQNYGLKGVSAARNTGIRYSSGLKIAFLDDDDEFSSVYKLEEQSNKLNKDRSLGIVGTNFQFIDTDRNIIKQIVQPETSLQICHSLNYSGGILFGSSIIRRDVFDAVGLFDTRFSYGEDTDLIYRILKRYQGYNIQEYMLNYTQHSHNSVNLAALPSIQGLIVKLKNGKSFPHYYEGLIISGVKIITPSFIFPIAKNIAQRRKSYMNLHNQSLGSKSNPDEKKLSVTSESNLICER